jgi:hypothetical protein
MDIFSKNDFAFMYKRARAHHIATHFSNIYCCTPLTEISVEISDYTGFSDRLKFLEIFKTQMLLKTSFDAEFQQHLLFLATMLLK